MATGRRTAFYAALGSYEHQLIGLEASYDPEEGVNSLSLEPIFGYAPHSASVRCVAVEGESLVSGSADETIRVYNLPRKQELGTVMEQSGTISSLAFAGPTHVLSGCSDGSIAVWRTRDWECLKVLKGHRHDVTSVAVHSSRAVALSCDRSQIRLWDLVKGRCCFKQNIKADGNQVVWGSNEQIYVCAFRLKVCVYSSEDNSTLATYASDPVLIHSIAIISERIIAIGLDDGAIVGWDWKDDVEVWKLTAHEKRIRALASIHVDMQGEAEDVITLVSGDSAGMLRVWVTDLVGTGKPKEVASHNTKARLTCVAISTPSPSTTVPNKKEKNVEHNKETGKKRARITDDAKHKDNDKKTTKKSKKGQKKRS